MRLWYVADARLPGRAANTVQIMKMSAAFAGLGHEVTLLIRLDRGASPTSLCEFYAVPKRFRLVHLPRLVPGQSSRDRWVIPFSLSALFYLRARARQFDLLYTRLPLLALLAVRLGLKVGLEVHRPLPHDGAMSRWLAQRVVRSSRMPAFAGLVSISQALRDEYAQLGLAPEKMLVAHDGVDWDRFDPPVPKEEARRRLDLPQASRIVGYCGHLYAGRGIEELLACAQQMPDVTFLFVGGADADVQEQQSRAASMGLANTRFTGFQPNAKVPLYLFAADVLAMPYNRRTGSAQIMSPMKLFEYMAAGRPIVATRFPSVCEVLADGRNAILVPPDDVASLATGLQRALLEPAAASFGQRARDDVLEYTWHKRAAKILQFLERPA